MTKRRTLHVIALLCLAPTLAVVCFATGDAIAAVYDVRSSATRNAGAANIRDDQKQPFIESDPTRANIIGAVSRVIARRDTVEDGAPACIVDFVYQGLTPESLLWKEPCADVTAEMMTQQDLEAQDDWNRLDSFDQQFINAMPEGKVLWVGGEFSAAIYPIGTTGLSYEVFVSD